MTEADAEIVAASLADPASFGALFDRHSRTIERFLLRRVNTADADGLVGEVFRVAFERRSSYDLARPDALPWFYGIASNVLAHHRRSEARRLAAMARLLARSAPEVSGYPEIGEALEARDAWTATVHALEQLSDTDRETLLLVVWEDLSYDDVAVALDVPIGTVKSRINRARKRLRELLNANGQEQAELTIRGTEP